MLPRIRQVKNLGRYRRVVTVFAKHGFGSVLEYMNLGQYLDLPKSLFKHTPSTRITPAEHLRMALEELGPTYIKLGQILSTRPDLIPPAYIRELSLLCENAAPLPWEKIKQQLTRELGDNFEQYFSSIETQPIGSASLAQVHQAKLLNGQEVVVKVQRPNIQNIIEIDLEILDDIARLVQHTPIGSIYNPIEVVGEFSTTLRNELDYRREGHNADQFRKNFSDIPDLYIPAIHWDLTTSKILVMEKISGVRIDDLAEIDKLGYDRQALALQAAQFIIKEVLEDGFFHADPHPGNLIVMPGGVIGVMDFGMVGHISRMDRYNLIRLYAMSIEIDSKIVAEQLIRMGAVAGKIDRRGLERDIDNFLHKYQGLPLEEITANMLMEDLIPLAFKHHLKLPTDLWLLAKTLAIMEGVGRKLDPTFDIFSVSNQFVHRLIRKTYLPDAWLPPLLSDLDNWRYLFSEIPRFGSTLIRSLDAGETPFIIKFGANKETLDRIDRLITGLSLSLLIAGLIIGLAMLLPIATGNPILLGIVVLGFILVFALGIWLAISLLRIGK
jgi:ubiquinone biosynthesis protein